MDRREFLKAAALGAAALAAPGGLLAAVAGDGSADGASGNGGKPNIILIFSDDVGLGNIGCYGAPARFKTPKIDALAKGGIRFDTCYSTPLCGPSRCEILTGRYPFRTGMTTNATGEVVSRSEVMMPKALKPAGYVTGMVGKWSQLTLEPADWGFDEYLRFPSSGRYWREQTKTYKVDGVTKDLPEGKYLPDIMYDWLVDFMTRHKDKPFYVHYAMSLIHGPIVRTPDSKSGSVHYDDMVAYMDKLVGELVDAVEKLKLREKTLLLFVGDNGTASTYANAATVHGRRLSGQKGSMLEGGSRVPMIANWPGTTPAGKTMDDLIDFSDFFPTFCALAGAKLPEGVVIDGHSFADRLKGKPGNPREWIYVELNGRWYARDKGYKLTKGGELLDMKEAPFVEKPIPSDTTDPAAIAARKRLQAVLEKLDPASGKQPKPGTPLTLRQANQAKPKRKKKKAAAQ